MPKGLEFRRVLFRSILISGADQREAALRPPIAIVFLHGILWFLRAETLLLVRGRPDRKSTRLNSSHLGISYAVFCLKKKKKTTKTTQIFRLPLKNYEAGLSDNAT